MIMRPMSLDDGRKLILIRVGRSWVGPHAEVHERQHTFWIRHGAQKQRMDYTELRQSFLARGSFSDSIQRFREERLIAIQAGDPVTMPGSRMLTLHLVPLSASDSVPRFDVRSLQSDLSGRARITSHGLDEV